MAISEYTDEQKIEYLRDFNQLPKRNKKDYAETNGIKWSTFRGWLNSPKLIGLLADVKGKPHRATAKPGNQKKPNVNVSKADQAEYVRKMMAGEMTIKAVAEECGCHASTVNYWKIKARKMGFKIKRTYNRKHTNQQMEKANSEQVNMPLAFDNDSQLDLEILKTEITMLKLIMRKAGVELPSYS